MMKVKIITLAVIGILFSCKESPKVETKEVQKEVNIEKHYPENISKIFKAHGGLKQWGDMKSLEFTIEKPEGKEVTFTNLKSRESLIKMPQHTIGFNGKDVWLQKKDTTTYKGNPKFYYNLMFYFGAMPFVLADEGITYSDAEPLNYEGESYPGIKINYGENIGESSEDEYVLYFNPTTFNMEWLGYTVTYFSKKKSKDFHYIKYSTWQEVNGLLFPETLSWYNTEKGEITTKRNDVKLTDVKLGKESYNDSLFEKPEGAEIVK